MNDLDLRRRRLRTAHHLIRAELAVAFGAPVVAGLFFVAAPGFMFESTLVATSLAAGIVGVVVGIVWMLRLSRPDPEGGQRTWRYRDF